MLIAQLESLTKAMLTFIQNHFSMYLLKQTLQHESAIMEFTFLSHSSKTTGMPALSVASAMPVPIVPSPMTATDLTR
jgi:hypothetical protein